MSAACTSGRHGVPSDSTRNSPVSTACPTRLFSTMSARSRGENPNAVALRIEHRDEVVVSELGDVVLDPDLATPRTGSRA